VSGTANARPTAVTCGHGAFDAISAVILMSRAIFSIGG